MKTLLMLTISLAAGSASAQLQGSGQTVNKETVSPARNSFVLTKPEKPNQIIGRKFTFSGVAVQLAKTDNPLQLLNPFAPERYGSGKDNVVHDPLSGEAAGVKVFCIEF